MCVYVCVCVCVCVHKCVWMHGHECVWSCMGRCICECVCVGGGWEAPSVILVYLTDTSLMETHQAKQHKASTHTIQELHQCYDVMFQSSPYRFLAVKTRSLGVGRCKLAKAGTEMDKGHMKKTTMQHHTPTCNMQAKDNIYTKAEGKLS